MALKGYLKTVIHIIHKVFHKKCGKLYTQKWLIFVKIVSLPKFIYKITPKITKSVEKSLIIWKNRIGTQLVQ